MADPQAVAVLAEGAAADLAMSDIGLTGSMALAEVTVLEMVLCDHRNLSTLFAHFEAAVQQQQQHKMQMHAAAIIQEIRLHSQAEEAVLYPMLESDASGSTDNAVLALTSREAHRMADQDMLGVLASVGCTLGGPLPPGSTPPDLAEAVQRLQADIGAHMVDEERNVLPRLAAAYSNAELVLAGKDFLAAKLRARFDSPMAAAAGTAMTAAASPQLAPAPLAAAGLPLAGGAPLDAAAGAPMQAVMPGAPTGATVTTGIPDILGGGAEGKLGGMPTRTDTAGEQAMVM